MIIKTRTLKSELRHFLPSREKWSTRHVNSFVQLRRSSEITVDYVLKMFSQTSYDIAFYIQISRDDKIIRGSSSPLASCCCFTWRQPPPISRLLRRRTSERLSPPFFPHTGNWAANQIAVNKGQNCAKSANPWGSTRHSPTCAPSPESDFPHVASRILNMAATAQLFEVKPLLLQEAALAVS